MFEPRKLITIVIVLFVLCFVDTTYAQDSYTPLEGLNSVTSTAKALVADAELTSLLTLTGAVPGLPIVLKYELVSGKSNGWIYIFYSPSLDTTFGYGLTRIFGVYLPIPFPLEALPLPIDLFPTSAIPKPWKNSGELYNILKKDQGFVAYHTKNPDSTASSVTLAINPLAVFRAGFPANSPAWMLTFGGIFDAELTCFVHAQSGQVKCVAGNANTVESDANAEFHLTPNPANELLKIRVMNSAVDFYGTVSVFDVLGTEVRQIATNSYVGSLISIDVSNLSNGTYFFIAKGLEGHFKTAFTVQH